MKRTDLEDEELVSAARAALDGGLETIEPRVAERLRRARLQAAGIADVLVVPGFIRGQTFYRVQIGPISGTTPSAVLQRQLQELGLTAYTVVQQ